MDYDDFCDALAFYFSNSDKESFSFGDIKRFFETNNVFDFFGDDFSSFLSKLVSDSVLFEDKSDSGESFYSYDNSFVDRITGKNEDLSMRWIIPKEENYDFDESSANNDNPEDDEFLLEADDPESKVFKEELIYDEE
ncbi:MAG: hypothetical protein AABW73_01390 [Nanoarchaeota archaeon]